MYIIKDENGEIMRIVSRQEEARYLVQCRDGWSFKRVKTTKRVDLSQFEDALL